MQTVDVLKDCWLLRAWYILGDPRAVNWVRINGGESFQERVREPPGCDSYRTSSTTHSNACLWLGAKNILCSIRGQLLSRRFRDLVIRRILPLNNSTVCCICLARAGELSSRTVFKTNKQKRKMAKCSNHVINSFRSAVKKKFTRLAYKNKKGNFFISHDKYTHLECNSSCV